MSQPPEYLGELSINKAIHDYYKSLITQQGNTTFDVHPLSLLKRVADMDDLPSQPDEPNGNKDDQHGDGGGHCFLQKCESTYTPSTPVMASVSANNLPPGGKYDLSLRNGLFHFGLHVASTWQQHTRSILAGTSPSSPSSPSTQTTPPTTNPSQPHPLSAMEMAYHTLEQHHTFDIFTHSFQQQSIASSDPTLVQTRRDILLSLNLEIQTAIASDPSILHPNTIAIPFGSMPIGLSTSTSDIDLVLVHSDTLSPVPPDAAHKFLSKLRAVPIYHFVYHPENTSNSNPTGFASSYTDTPLDPLRPDDPVSPFYWLIRQHLYTPSKHPIGSIQRELYVKGGVNCLKMSTYWGYETLIPPPKVLSASQKSPPHSFRGPSVDCVASNDPSITKALFLATHLALSPYLQPMIAVVNTWAKHRLIKDASMGYFNSFAIYMLVIFFLQVKGLLPTVHRNTLQEPPSQKEQWPWKASMERREHLDTLKQGFDQQVDIETDVVETATTPTTTNTKAKPSIVPALPNPHCLRSVGSTTTANTHIYHTNNTPSRFKPPKPFITMCPNPSPSSTHFPLQQIPQIPSSKSYAHHIIPPPFTPRIDHYPDLIDRNPLYKQYVTSTINQDDSFSLPYGHPAISAKMQLTRDIMTKLEVYNANPDTEDPVMLPLHMFEHTLRFYTPDEFEDIIREDCDAQPQLYTIDWSVCGHPDAALYGLHGYHAYIGMNRATQFMSAPQWITSQLYTIPELKQQQQEHQWGHDTSLLAPSPSTAPSPTSTTFSYSVLSILLYEFFHFYAYVVDFRLMVPSIRLGHLVFRECCLQSDHCGFGPIKPFIGIEDPIIPSDNPCRGVNRAPPILYELRRAAYMLRNNVPWWRINMPLQLEMLSYGQLTFTFQQSVMYTRLPSDQRSNIIHLLLHYNETLCTFVQKSYENVFDSKLNLQQLLQSSPSSLRKFYLEILIKLFPSILHWVQPHHPDVLDASLVDLVYHPFISLYLQIPDTYRLKDEESK